MPKLYKKISDYLKLSAEYSVEYKKLCKEEGVKYISQSDLTGKTKEVFDKLPDFECHFQNDIYEPHGLFTFSVLGIKMFILYGHEEIKVVTHTKIISKMTR